MLPPYISIIVPCGAAAFWILVMIIIWNEQVVPYAIIHYHLGVPTPASILSFAVAAAYLTAYMVAPAAAAWLLAFRTRTRNRLAVNKSWRMLERTLVTAITPFIAFDRVT
jgi:hypothetical protein